MVLLYRFLEDHQVDIALKHSNDTSLTHSLRMSAKVLLESGEFDLATSASLLAALGIRGTEYSDVVFLIRQFKICKRH